MTQDWLRTAVVGAGYVGVVTAVGLAEQGRDIVLVEQDRLDRFLDLDARDYSSYHGMVSFGDLQGSPWSPRRLYVSSDLRTPPHFDELATLDLGYIDQWSLALDLRIPARSVAAVLGGAGRSGMGEDLH